MLSSASTREARGALSERFCAMATSVRSFHWITGLASGWVMKLKDPDGVEPAVECKVASFIIKVASFIIRTVPPVECMDSVGGEGLPSRAAPSAGVEGCYDGLRASHRSEPASQADALS